MGYLGHTVPKGLTVPKTAEKPNPQTSMLFTNLITLEYLNILGYPKKLGYLRHTVTKKCRKIVPYYVDPRFNIRAEKGFYAQNTGLGPTRLLDRYSLS